MSTAAYARRYAEFGLVLTWTLPSVKGPRHPGWNLREKAIDSPAAALKHWTKHPTHGIGCLLSYSGLVSLDVDDAERTRIVLTHFGIDLGALAARTPCISGRPDRFRLMFRVPESVELRHRSVTWPDREDQRKGFVLFELRAGAISDALPPTIHADTGQPYRWAIPPRAGFPPLPDRLLEVWQDWPTTDRAARALCPWYVAPQPSPRSRLRPRDSSQPSVIAAFNAAHDVSAILESHGYQRRGRRFASPDTSHAAGVVLLESGKVYCHHAGDPLSGRARDAFDLFVQLEHGGDVRWATREAARLLGMDRRTAA